MMQKSINVTLAILQIRIPCYNACAWSLQRPETDIAVAILPIKNPRYKMTIFLTDQKCMLLMIHLIIKGSYANQSPCG